MEAEREVRALGRGKSRAIEPYRMVTNKLIELVNEIAYRRKEEVIERILKLMNS